MSADSQTKPANLGRESGSRLLSTTFYTHHLRKMIPRTESSLTSLPTTLSDNDKFTSLIPVRRSGRVLSATGQPYLESSSTRLSLSGSCSRPRPGLPQSSGVLRRHSPRPRWQGRPRTARWIWLCPVPEKGPRKDDPTLERSRWRSALSGTRRRTIGLVYAYRSREGRTAEPHTRPGIPQSRYRPRPILRVSVESTRTCYVQ